MSLLLPLLASAITPTTAPRLKLGPDVHVHVEGNSLFAPLASQGIENLGNMNTVLSGAGVSTSNTSLPEGTWDELRLRVTSGASSYQPGKTNVLITGETTNQIYRAGSSVDETITKAQHYISTQRAAHPDWIILLVGTIPRADLATPELNRTANSKLLEVDAYQRTHLADIGAHGFVDVRAYAPEWFALRPDGVTAPFMDSLETCHSYDGVAPDRVHPRGVSRVAFAHAIAAVLSELPAKA